MMRSREQGIALLLAAFAALLLSLAGLSLTLTSLSEFSMSQEFETHYRALQVADAGLSAQKNNLRGKDSSVFLATAAVVPQYLEYDIPAVHTYAYRNPLLPLEARSVDFDDPPSSSGSRAVKGFLTPSSGTTLGRGRYFARLTDNRDEEPLGLPDNPEVDQDGTVYLRVMGIHRGPRSELSSYGGSIKNSVAILEAVIRHDMTFHTGSPFAVYGSNVMPAGSNLFDGNSFRIDGYDHVGWNDDDITRPHNHNLETGQAAIGVINDDPAAGDGAAAMTTIYNSLSPQQQNNLIGAPGPWGSYPSLQDNTNDIRTSSDPDAAHIFDADFVANFINKVASVADYRYPGGTTLSGSSILLGTSSDPKITVALGDLTISGNGSGAGVLIVRGALNYQGAFDYRGIILVAGTGSVTFGGANKSLIGGIYVSQLIQDANGQYSFGTPAFTLSGNTKFYFKSEAVRMGMSLLPMKTLSWREITPEIEPNE